jgi:hypothetical protein
MEALTYLGSLPAGFTRRAFFLRFKRISFCILLVSRTSSLLSHSQITPTRQSKAFNFFVTRVSRSTFILNFWRQNADDGADAFGHPGCRCQ